MRLDVVVPTYNRSGLLELALRSLLDTPAPATLRIEIFVVDNNSVDDTRAVVQRIGQGAARPVHYLHQPLQGLSHARNAAIAVSTADLIGFIDDDEQIEPGWFDAVAREFADPATDYISGPYLAPPDLVLPPWFPDGFNGVIGVVPARPRQSMGKGYSGILMGGNGVMRRSLFDRTGLYNPRLGRSGNGLLSDEDVDLYRRIQQAGLRGFHVPDLAILHHIPASRLTLRYFRRWFYWRGISQGIADRSAPEEAKRFARMPAYRIREGLAGLLALPVNLLGPVRADRFKRELPFWTLLGFVRGRFLARVEALYRPAPKQA